MTEIERFTQSKPCPVCGGSQDDVRGRGTRCGGFLSGDGKYAHCTRIEYANGLQVQGSSQSYRHKLLGTCACGVGHGEVSRRRIVATHDYKDAGGKLIYQAIRFEPKNFALRRPDGVGGWVWNMDGVARLPYRLPDLLRASTDEPVFIPEGEKHVDRLIDLGLLATTNSEGAGKWRPDLNRHLANRSVVLLPDNDDPGRRHVELVTSELADIVFSLKIVVLPDLAPKGDVINWLDAGHTVAELLALTESAPLWQRTKPAVGGDPRDVADDEYDLTDLGNARRLVARHGADLKFSKGKGWLVWDGVRWTPSESAVVRRAKEVTDDMKRRAAAEPDQEKSKRLFNWAHQSQNASKIRAMVALAESEPQIEISDDELDANLWLFNCQNGTLDLHTGTLQPHRRDDLITKLAPVSYEAGARSVRWEQFLLETVHENRALLNYLQKAAGYTLTGDTSEEYLFFVHGPARTGKSTFMAALKATMGDYALTADFETFLAKKFGGGTRNDIARLAGARFVSSIEVEEGQKLAEAIVKELTGGDSIAARFLYKEFFEFKPQFKLWLCANHRPRVRSDDDAIWRRIRVIPFVNVVPPERQDRGLKAELTNAAVSGSAILAWLADGCILWQKEGLGAPPIVTEATRDYQEDMDPLRDFFEERCELNPSANVLKKDLFDAYGAWARDEGIKYPLTKRKFGDRLTAMGLRDAPGHSSGRAWQGIRLVGNLTADEILNERRY